MKHAIMGLLASVMLAGPAAAQTYPNHTIRVLEPLAAASAVDTVTRIVSEKMSQILGQSLYVDNQPGAAGLLGMRAGARAAPDGYTVLAVNDSVLTVLPNMRKDAGYDSRKDFVPITLLARLHWVMIANPAFPAKNLQEFIALAKAKPGAIDYGTGGQGSPQHIAMELLMRAADIKLTHVPFRGVTQALTDVVSGHVPVMFIALPGPMAFYESKQLNFLASADLKRVATLPAVPTISEQGLPNFEFTAWAAFFAPANTPPAIIARLNEAAKQALADPVINKQLTDLGYEVVGSTPEELRDILAKDFESKGELLRAANIHAD
jgi:tripartite-type tricarboxylate transporter receptor subunit TctC